MSVNLFLTTYKRRAPIIIEFGSLAPKLDTTIITLADFSDYDGYDDCDGDFFYNYYGDFFIIRILGIFIIFWKAILTTQRYFSGRRLSLHSDTIIAKIIAEIIAELIAKIITENYS